MTELSLKDIDLSFSIGTQIKQIFKSFSWEFRKPGLYAITGRSGSGKTTLLNLICGRLIPQSGRILSDGEEWNDTEKIYLSPSFPKAQITIRELYLLSLYQKGYVLAEAQAKIDLFLAGTGVFYCLDKKIKNLSSGEKSLAEYYCYRLIEADFYCFDEPFSGLSRENILELEADLLKLSEDKAVIIAFHPRSEQNEFLKRCQRIAL